MLGNTFDLSQTISALGQKQTSGEHKRKSAKRYPWIVEAALKNRQKDPILLPRGRQIVTQQDAGTYITKLPKAEHEAAECRQRWRP